MRKMLNKFLGLAAPEAVAIEATPPCAARDRLRAAHVNLQRAERVVEECAAESAHVASMLTDSEEADEAKSAAEQELREASRAWAESGAKGETPMNIRALEEIAKRASGKAYVAAIRARGFEDALSSAVVWDSGQSRMTIARVLPRHAEAIEEKRQADAELQSAIREVLLSEVQPVLIRARQARESLESELSTILALYEVLHMGPSVVPFAGKSMELIEAVNRLVAPLSANQELQSFHRGQTGGLTELKERWLSFGRTLAQDSNAEFNSCSPEGNP